MRKLMRYQTVLVAFALQACTLKDTSPAVAEGAAGRDSVAASASAVAGDTTDDEVASLVKALLPVSAVCASNEATWIKTAT